MLEATHRQVEPFLVGYYNFPIGLVPDGILLGAKSIGKVGLRSEFSIIVKD